MRVSRQREHDFTPEWIWAWIRDFWSIFVILMIVISLSAYTLVMILIMVSITE